MKLVNKTTGKIISPDLKIASSLSEASLGLLSRPKGTVMLFRTRWGIHTFLMKYPIDVIVLDKKMLVVKIKKNLQPNRLFFWNPQFDLIIELPSPKNSASINDILKIL